MKNTLLLVFALFTLQASAQNAAQNQQEKMKVLSAWAGTWSGEGWMMLPDGKKHQFVQKEVVTSKIDGGALTIDGSGKDKETGKGIHDALGFITFDVIKQQYRFTAMTGMGYITDVVPEVKENGGLIWTLNSPAGIMKFSIQFNQTEWIETGEISKDKGATWFKNFEMTLKRQ